MMKGKNLRSGAAIFGEFLVKGQRVDWKYSLVVVLVITGMFSTPLALGSIRNRVYVAVREQIEKENNAREISVQKARDEAPPLDDAFVAELKDRFPAVQVVGNHKLVVSVEGPQGSDFLTLQTLVPGDPRGDPLQVPKGVPADFAATDLVVSDSLGRLLYGEDWESLWSPGSGEFHGPPLSLRINELPMDPEFRVRARRTLPGRGLYASSQVGAALRRYTQGFGSPLLGLPVDEDLVEYSLPKLTTPSCTLLFAGSDSSCGDLERQSLLRRLRELHFEVDQDTPVPFPTPSDHSQVRVGLTELDLEGGRTLVRESRGDCQEILSPHLVQRCQSALILPDLALDLTIARTHSEALQAVHDPVIATTLYGVTSLVHEWLPGVAEMRQRHGAAPPGQDAVSLTLPFQSGLSLGESVDLGVGEHTVPGLVAAFYTCPEPEGCPVFTDTLAAFRLKNLMVGSIVLQSRQPLVFVPADRGSDYDEVLLYASQVEDVAPLVDRLRERYTGYSINYNVAAIDKLRRQDSRLSTLFTITITLSALFIVLALGSLAQINVERRSRQMAQMLILGFSRRFVRRLVVAEYLLLTVVSSLASLVLTALLCFSARSLLRSHAGEGSGRGFEVIVESMNVDARAFLLVFAVVAVCTWFIALASARKAAKADPLNLLD